MTAKQFLLQYQKLTWDIERLSRDITDIEESIDSMPTNYDGTPRSNNISRRTENIAIKLSTLKADKEKRKADAINKREEITAAIAKVSDAVLSRLLYDRYIKLMPWRDIADDIDRSEYWTRTDLHSRALREITEIIKK